MSNQDLAITVAVTAFRDFQSVEELKEDLLGSIVVDGLGKPHRIDSIRSEDGTSLDGPVPSQSKFDAVFVWENADINQFRAG